MKFVTLGQTEEKGGGTQLVDFSDPFSKNKVSRIHIHIVNWEVEFIPADPVSYCLALAKFNDKAVIATYKEFRDTRTLRQNKAWHGIVVPIFMQCYGEHFNHEAAHYTLLGLIHYDVSQDLNGKLTRSVRKSHNLSTIEFNELYQKAQQFMAEEYEMDVPDPDPEYRKWRIEAKGRQARPSEGETEGNPKVTCK